MNNELAIFEFVFDAEKMAGVYGVSLVADPAIEISMMHFSKEIKQEWKLSNEEKRILTSPVLVPNQKVYRESIQGKPGYVFASELTIEKLQQNFAKQKYNHNSSLEHSTPIDGVYFSESWIINDPKNDKANALGFGELPKGTWMLSMKVDNDEVWEEYVKTGRIGGFSIDGELATTEIKNNTEIKFQKMNKQTILDVIKMSIEKVAMATELKEFKISDTVSYWGSDLEVGSIIVDSNKEIVKDAEFEYDGKKYETDEFGAIKETEVVEEEPKVEDEVKIEVEELAVDPEKAIDAVADANTETRDLRDDSKIIEDLHAEVDALRKKVEELEVEKANLEAEIVSKSNEVVEMKAHTPASVGIVDRPSTEKADNKSETMIETLKRLRK